MNRILTPDLAANYLGVSTATIQNWLKAGILKTLTLSSLAEFEKDNYKGRLSHRANKKISSRLFSPHNYGRDSSIRLSKIKKTLEELKEFSLEETLFFAVTDLIEHSPPINNTYLKREMNQWKITLFHKGKQIKHRPVFPEAVTNWQDFPGWLYQSLDKEGSKSSKGAYFTPEDKARKIVEDLLPERRKGCFFDPSCGTGTFLCLAALRWNDPLAVYGQDSDPLAVKLARINLMLLFPHREFNPQIYLGDSLLSPHRELLNKKFTHIATNPPWGCRFTSREKLALKKCYGTSRLDSSSYFILAADQFLQAEGKGCMLLPESLLHRKKHKEFRKKILSKVVKITWFGQIFSGVQSECFALCFSRSEQKKPIIIEGFGKRYSRKRESFSETPLNVWNIFTTPAQEKIFKKLFNRPHLTLKEGTHWGMGIVTGNNRKHLKKKTDRHLLPLVTGKDVKIFTPLQPDTYLNYKDPRLQQKAPLKDYLSPKILYRFIARKPVLVLEDQGYLTLNSVNFFMPSLPYKWETVILLFNSALYGLYFQKTFHTLKVLRCQLEYLPLPQLDIEEEKEFSRLYPLLIRDFDHHKEKWNNFVYQCFGITEKEREILEKDL